MPITYNKILNSRNTDYKPELDMHNKFVFTGFIIGAITMLLVNNGSFLNPTLGISPHQIKSLSNISNSINRINVSSHTAASHDPSASTSPSLDSNSVINSNVKSINNKVVVLSFDDNRIGDFTYAKPILDKYGFKATFFVICGKTTDSGAMNWQNIAAMQKDGMDIESHTMTHAHLNTLTQSQLNFEIGGSKQCLASNGYNATIFAYPYNEGSNNATVVNLVAKYYNMARSGTEQLMFLDCKGFTKHPQADCRTYTPDGKLTYANRYAIRSLSFDVLEIKDSFDNATMFSDFTKIVNSQNSYNQGSKINAVPLITFHNVALTTNKPYYTNAGLFDKFMRYLHDNGFKVLTLKQIGYDPKTSTFYLRSSPETTTIVTTNTNRTLASSMSNVNNKTPSTTMLTTTTNATNIAHHIKGVKLLHVHTEPSVVAVGKRFNLQGIVYNNSSATITFANGTCSPSPLSIKFNGKVMTEPQAAAAAPCKAQQVTLKHGEQSAVLIPNISGISYVATAPGITNATMGFKYGDETATSKSPFNDSISRVYSFNIHPASNQSGASTSTTPNQLQHLKEPVPIQTTRSGTNLTAAANATSVKTSIPVLSNPSSYSVGGKNNVTRGFSASVYLGKNTVHPGDEQTIRPKVADANTTNAIAGAKVTGSIMNPSRSLTTSLDGTTVKHYIHGQQVRMIQQVNIKWTCNCQLLTMKILQFQNHLKSLLYQ
jgi:peptidoglycan/xylan/chitin deacetylase (PgdA/CDA1 family)